MQTGKQQKENGNAAFKAGNFEEAVEWYSCAIAADPEEPTYYSNRSVSYHRMGKFRKALDDAQKCTELRSDWPKGFFRVGEAYMGLKLPAKAAKAFQQSLDLNSYDEHVQACLKEAEEAVMQKSLQDEDDDLIPSGAFLPPKSSFVGAKRQEVLCNRFVAPSITSMSDYQRFREVGGAQVKKDDDLTSSYLSEVPEAYKPTMSRQQFFHQYGIEESQATTVEESAPTVGGSSANGSSLLAQKRAEFLASLGVSPTTGSGGSPSSTSTPSQQGLTGEWSKIRGASHTTSNTHEDEEGNNETPEEAYRRLRAEKSSNGSSRVPGGANTSFRRNVHSSGSSGSVEHHSHVSPTATASSSSSYHRISSPQERDENEKHYAALDERLGMTPHKGSTKQDSPVTSLQSSPSTKHSYESTLGGGSSSSSTPKSTSYFAECRALPQRSEPSPSNHPSTPLAALTTFDYAAVGALDGSGSVTKNQWLQQYKSKSPTSTGISTDPKLEHVKSYSDFSYRKFKEGHGQLMDRITNHNVMDNAILADALGEYSR